MDREAHDLMYEQSASDREPNDLDRGWSAVDREAQDLVCEPQGVDREAHDLVYERCAPFCGLANAIERIRVWIERITILSTSEAHRSASEAPRIDRLGDRCTSLTSRSDPYEVSRNPSTSSAMRALVPRSPEAVASSERIPPTVSSMALLSELTAEAICPIPASC
jgi:hypothetical protein